MKAIVTIGAIGFLIAAVTNECHANLNGSDNFAGSSKNTTNWGAEFDTGVGVLTQTNGQVVYTTIGSPTQSDFAGWPWIRNQGNHTQSWEAQLDVNVPQTSLGASQGVLYGLLVFPGTNAAMLKTNRFVAALEQSGTQHEFFCSLTVNAMSSTDLGQAPTTSTSGSVRIAFDPSTDLLSAYYDENGAACGYSWTILAATNLDADWSLTSTSVFTVVLFGNGNSYAVTSTNVFGNNFRASSGNNPGLGISPAGNKVVLTWATNGPTVHLESTATLSPPVCWQVVTNPAGITSTNFTVTNAVSGENTYFRLSR